MPDLLDTPAEVLEVPEISADPIETPDIDPSAPVATEEQEDTRTPEQIEADDKSPLWKQAKPNIDAIRKDNPALARKIDDALRQYDSLKPQDVREIKTLKTEIGTLAASLGGGDYAGKAPAEILSEVKGQLGYFHSLDAKFTNGDPTFASDLSSASPEAFEKLAPAVISEYAKVNPEGYSSFVAKAAVDHMVASDVPLQFKMLALLVPRLPDSPEKSEVIDAINKIHGWTEALSGFAKAPLQQTKKPDDAATLETQRQELASREAEVTRTSWNTTATRKGNDLLNSEMTRLSGKTALSAEQKQAIFNKAAEEIDARMTANRPYGEAMRGFIQSKDQTGYTKRLHSEYQKLIPGAVSRAYADVVTTPKTVAKTNPAAKVAAVAGIVKAPDGWKTIDTYPVGRVDMRQTTGKMMDEGKLIMKDGSKVIYKRRA